MSLRTSLMIVIGVFGGIVFIGISAPAVCRSYSQRRALLNWERKLQRIASAKVKVFRLHGGPGFHSPEFRAVMEAFGLKDSDLPERFIEVLGPPKTITDAPELGRDIKEYRWGIDRHCWPQPTWMPTTQ